MHLLLTLVFTNVICILFLEEEEKRWPWAVVDITQGLNCSNKQVCPLFQLLWRCRKWCKSVRKGSSSWVVQWNLTSPAPRNKKVWSARVQPCTFKDAISPARTTDAVPYDRRERDWWRNWKINKIMNSENITWISSLNTRWVVRYFAKRSKAL